MVSLFQFLLFRSSEWQKISAESTFRGIHFGPVQVSAFSAVSAASAEFTWPSAGLSLDYHQCSVLTIDQSLVKGG